MLNVARSLKGSTDVEEVIRTRNDEATTACSHSRGKRASDCIEGVSMYVEVHSRVMRTFSSEGLQVTSSSSSSRGGGASRSTLVGKFHGLR